MAKLKYTFVPTAKKSIALAKSYVLKGVPMPSGLGGRVLGHLGLSFGTQQLTGDLKKVTTAMDAGNYVNTGFPYRRGELVGGAQGVSEAAAQTIRNRDQAIKYKQAQYLDPAADKTKIISLINNENFEAAHDGYNKTGISFYIDSSSQLKNALDEQNSQTQVSGRKLYLLAFYDLNKGDQFDKIELPFMPTGMEFKPESNWVNISAFGRNSPPLQYLGGQDTLTFDIDWYSTKGDYSGIFALCKKVESYSKADGYKKQPPVINLLGVVGIEDTDFVITSAPYSVKQFTGVANDSKVVPLHIIQTITLQKVSVYNPTWEDIQYKIINTTER